MKWTARDADGDPLIATVDYSADGGRHWRVVADRVRAGSARVPSRLLSASRNGRLRVRVSDGFNAAVATSGRLRAAGAAPLVRIIRSGRGNRVRAGTTLLLKGAAFDDADRPLTGRHLKWYAGRKLLGRGELLSVMNLSPDVKSIRLVATDARRRSSQAVLTLKVIAVPPAFLVARAPTHIKATATARANRGRIDGPVGAHDRGRPSPRRPQTSCDHAPDSARSSPAAPEVLASRACGRDDPRRLRGKALNRGVAQLHVCRHVRDG